MRYLFVATALIVLCTRPVVGQVDQTSSALQLTHFEKVGKDYFYRYRLVGAEDGHEVLSDIYLEVAQPRGKGHPRITGVRGRFLFDALAEKGLQPTVGHAPLFIATPDNWSAAIYIQGVLSWGADRWAGGANHGVYTGRELEGFELISSAVPSLRRFRVVPYRPFASEADQLGRADTSWVLHTGMILAPGWEASLVDASYLQGQVRAACEAHLLDSCGRYLRLTDDMLAAENRRDDHRYRRALQLFRGHLERDRVSHRNARFVLDAALVALERRVSGVRTSGNP